MLLDSMTRGGCGGGVNDVCHGTKQESEKTGTNKRGTSGLFDVRGVVVIVVVAVDRQSIIVLFFPGRGIPWKMEATIQ